MTKQIETVYVWGVDQGLMAGMAVRNRSVSAAELASGMILDFEADADVLRAQSLECRMAAGAATDSQTHRFLRNLARTLNNAAASMR